MESLELCRDLGFRRTVIQTLHVLAGIAATKMDPSRAATLAAAAEALHEATHSRPWAGEERIRDRFLATVREQLDERAFEEARGRGLAMTLEDAVEFALQPTDWN